MADKEYIAVDPSDVRNVAKELMSVNVMMQQGTHQAKMLHDIYARVVNKVKDRSVAEKALLLTNIRIEAEVNKIKLLEDAKLKGIISAATATSRINKSYEKMGSMLNAQANFQNKIAQSAASAASHQKLNASLTKGLSGIFSAMAGEAQTLLGTMGKFGSIMFFLVDILTKVVQIFNSLDESAMTFRKEMGFTRQFTRDIDNMARATAVEFARLGVTGKDAYEAVAGISKELFSSMSVTPDLVKNISLMSAQLGVTAASTAELYKSLGMAGRTAAGAQKDMVLFAASLSEAAGTPLKEVMSDINAATKSSYQFVSKSSIAMIKAAVEARRMGTSIESATKTASGLLDFTQNVKDEMEASVLLGKSINLQKARELAYHRDIKGLNKEILNIIKETDFENLDPLQQKAVAKMLGKEADELGKMAQAERERVEMLKVATPKQKEQYDLYRKMEEAKANEVKDYSKLMDAELKREGNQTRIKNITNSWNAIMMKLSEKLLPIIDKTLEFIALHFDKIVASSAMFFGLLKATGPVFTFIGKTVGFIGKGVELIGRGLRYIPLVGRIIGGIFVGVGKTVSWLGGLFIRLRNLAQPVVNIVVGIGGAIGRLFGIAKPLVGIAGFFGKWLNPIGWIITGIMFIINLFKSFSNVEFVKGDWIGNIWKGVKAIGMALYDTLLKPFADVYHWIMKHLGAESPSEIGLAMLQGIKAVGTAIMDALLYPYKAAWELIKKIPFVSSLFGSKNIAAKAVPEAKAAVDVERPGGVIDTKKASDSMASSVDNMSNELIKKLSSIVDAINAMRDDMKNGTLTAAVYIDSQKLDAVMGRRLQYTGALA